MRIWFCSIELRTQATAHNNVGHSPGIWFVSHRASAGVKLVDLLIHELKKEEKVVIFPIVLLV